MELCKTVFPFDLAETLSKYQSSRGINEKVFSRI